MSDAEILFYAFQEALETEGFDKYASDDLLDEISALDLLEAVDPVLEEWEYMEKDAGARQAFSRLKAKIRLARFARSKAATPGEYMLQPTSKSGGGMSTTVKTRIGNNPGRRGLGVGAGRPGRRGRKSTGWRKALKRTTGYSQIRAARGLGRRKGGDPLGNATAAATLMREGLIRAGGTAAVTGTAAGGTTYAIRRRKKKKR
jgi:hypothetical protein